MARSGSFKVNFASRDDAKAGDSETPGWSPDRTADNATKAAQDSRTLAYVGEFDSGATAISIPITNEASFVQVSPAATTVGLTKLVPGADKGEPDKYYPSGDRTFARVIPADDVQASAGAAWAKRLGARRVYLVDDKSVGGEGLVDQFSDAVERLRRRHAGRGSEGDGPARKRLPRLRQRGRQGEARPRLLQRRRGEQRGALLA